MKFSRFVLSDCDVKLLNLLNNNLRFGGGLSVNLLLSMTYFPCRGFFHLQILMNECIKILVVEVSKKKCFTGTFKPKSGVTNVSTNVLKIKKI